MQHYHYVQQYVVLTAAQAVIHYLCCMIGTRATQHRSGVAYALSVVTALSLPRPADAFPFYLRMPLGYSGLDCQMAHGCDRICAAGASPREAQALPGSATIDDVDEIPAAWTGTDAFILLHGTALAAAAAAGEAGSLKLEAGAAADVGAPALISFETLIAPNVLRLSSRATATPCITERSKE